MYELFLLENGEWVSVAKEDADGRKDAIERFRQQFKLAAAGGTWKVRKL